ncbi:MAG: ribonuclease PH [Deltaproteobacteria bacterium]|nr:ribonuclease PH [Deltaproteobacteria bacterium]MBN2845352.1 ribonuclease PH [Deltaproteobacteria bacterium]
MRNDGRKWDEIRKCRVTRKYLPNANGSALIEMGGTKVICTASVEDRVPPFLRDSGRGWLTAEYSMLPMATPTRNTREATRGRLGGRTHEIQRLIGRSLRSVTDLTLFGEKTIYIDCDVIQADGGTRTASITGSFIALVDAFRSLKEEGRIDHFGISDYVSAISVGLVGGEIMLDLDYSEDSTADVDANFVMTRSGNIIEIQGTAEGEPFRRTLLDKMIDVAQKGVAELTEMQINLLGELI